MIENYIEGFRHFSLFEQWLGLKEYFFSAYQNTLSDLSLFTGLFILFFIIKHLHANKKIRAARQSIPLVIGGWGTRGKSGTERLKSALFSALGYGLVSKTTGCEAMFLIAHPFGPIYEMFLFRPYDKATIWEQPDVMQYAEGFNTDIFLWECMALRPVYVHLMQRQWVRDDISTITNTYPDHEDIQGPAGINIPEVMTEFIPQSGRLITSEEEMLPILRTACDDLHTQLEEVSWLNVGLLTPDVLERFPYKEHPSNIALVVKLGEEIGIKEDFILKEIADHVIPDLGVLKVYPTAEIKSRRLVFINGMSANERYASLGNWTRMAFDKLDPYLEKGIWISAIVNNRADRVARSQVFARMLVNDINADKYFLIGTNLQGFSGYLEDEWKKFASKQSLWSGTSLSNNAEETLIHFARKYRIAYLEEHVIERLRAMLVGSKLNVSEDEFLTLWNQPLELAECLANSNISRLANEIIEHHKRNVDECVEYQSFLVDVTHAKMNERESIDNRFRALLEQWFKRKVYRIENANASGNQIINDIVCRTPPGYENRIMGMQNIKGTGLNFVYDWQDWSICYLSCEKLRQRRPGVFEQGLRELGTFQAFNLLCDKYVRDTVNEIQTSPLAQQEYFQAEIKNILHHLNESMKPIESEINTIPDIGWLEKIMKPIRSISNINHAIRRRKLANAIYQDLITERISLSRAVTELQDLNKKQHDES